MTRTCGAALVTRVTRTCDAALVTRVTRTCDAALVTRVTRSSGARFAHLCIEGSGRRPAEVQVGPVMGHGRAFESNSGSSSDISSQFLGDEKLRHSAEITLLRWMRCDTFTLIRLKNKRTKTKAQGNVVFTSTYQSLSPGTFTPNNLMQ